MKVHCHQLVSLVKQIWLLTNLCYNTFQRSWINGKNSVTSSERRQRGGKTLHYLALIIVIKIKYITQKPLTQQYNTSLHKTLLTRVSSNKSKINTLYRSMKALPASPLNAFSTATPLSSSCLCFSSTCSSCLWMIWKDIRLLCYEPWRYSWVWRTNTT